jgi:thiol:disulfide interchange protein
MSARQRPSLAAVLLAVLVVGLIVVVARRERSHLGHGQMRWVPIEQGLAQARSTGKPILYEFTAAWCPPCRNLEEDVFADTEYAARINAAYVPVRVVDRKREDGRNRSEVDDLQRRYGVDGFPTVIIADADGKVRGRLVGYGNARRFMQDLEAASR